MILKSLPWPRGKQPKAKDGDQSPRRPQQQPQASSSHHHSGGHKPRGSVLDLDPAQYDPVTLLPATIQVGAYSVKPLVTLEQVHDHLVLLAAFDELALRSGDRFHRVADSAAFEYERWAMSVLPARQLAKLQLQQGQQPQQQQQKKRTSSAGSSSRRSSDSANANAHATATATATATSRPAQQQQYNNSSSSSGEKDVAEGSHAAGRPHAPPRYIHAESFQSHSHGSHSHAHGTAGAPLSAPGRSPERASTWPTTSVSSSGYGAAAPTDADGAAADTCTSPTSLLPPDWPVSDTSSTSTSTSAPRSLGSVAGGAVASIVSTLSSSSATSSPSSSISPAALAPSELPPLAVLMCWHAHLMSPARYAADTDGTYASLHGVPFPLAEAAAAVRANTLPCEVGHAPSSTGGMLRHVPSISGWTPPDVSAAVQRQARIVRAVREQGWLRPSFVDGDVAPFQAAIVRYHAWLDLTAAVSPAGGAVNFLAPTTDIQLAWRTHQLRGARYRAETGRILGGTPLDHADKIAVDADALKRTAGLWKARFKREYLVPVQGRKPARRSTV